MDAEVALPPNTNRRWIREGWIQRSCELQDPRISEVRYIEIILRIKCYGDWRIQGGRRNSRPLVRTVAEKVFLSDDHVGRWWSSIVEGAGVISQHTVISGVRHP